MKQELKRFAGMHVLISLSVLLGYPILRLLS